METRVTKPHKVNLEQAQAVRLPLAAGLGSARLPMGYSGGLGVNAWMEVSREGEKDGKSLRLWRWRWVGGWKPGHVLTAAGV